MKALSLTIACLFSINCAAQNSFAYEPYFSAVVVRNIGVSKSWYQSVFGLKVKTESHDIQGGYKVAILESENLLVELMELRGSLSRDTLVANKVAGTQIRGHFKIGFKVDNIDACLKKLSQLQIEVPHVWEDKVSRKRNFIIKDPDGNLIQFFD